MRATVLLRELRDGYGYRGSYTSLRRRVARLRPVGTADPVVRFETGPGIQIQGDWTDCGSWPLGDGSAELFAWVAILGCSRMLAVRFATDKTRAIFPAIALMSLSRSRGSFRSSVSMYPAARARLWPTVRARCACSVAALKIES